jgi:heme-degrading monooxygenase HmoA
MESAFSYIWEFEVTAAMETEFLRSYGPEGEWVALFRQHPGYLDTRLLRDAKRPGRYLTVDRWRSEASYREFRESHAAQYAALDRSCEALTQAEQSLGEYLESVGPPGPIGPQTR